MPIKGQESKSTPFIDLKFLNLRWGVAYAYQILFGTNKSKGIWTMAHFCVFASVEHHRECRLWASIQEV